MSFAIDDVVVEVPVVLLEVMLMLMRMRMTFDGISHVSATNFHSIYSWKSLQ